MLGEAQGYLRDRFSRMGVTVEVNPSSNLLIADMRDLEEHPIFQLQPLPGQPAPEGGTLQVALGDDDPVTFATCLRDEYVHMFFALLRHGVTVDRAMGWIEGLGKNGWRARFTLPESADRELMNQIFRRPTTEDNA